MIVLPVPLLLLLWPAISALVNAQSSSSSVTGLHSGPSISVSPSSSVVSSGLIQASATSTAAFPTLSGYSPCVVNCLGLSISQVGCNSIVDVDCYCHNATRFVRDITSCVSSQCLSDLASAENVSQLFCNVANPNVSLSFSSLPSTQSSSSSLPSSTPSTSTSNSLSSSTLGPSGTAATPPTASQNASQANNAATLVSALHAQPTLSFYTVAALMAIVTLL